MKGLGRGWSIGTSHYGGWGCATGVKIWIKNKEIKLHFQHFELLITPSTPPTLPLDLFPINKYSLNMHSAVQMRKVYY